MSLSPISSKSIVFLLGLLYLQAYTVDATISTSAGFPQDVFAKPAFQVNFGTLSKHAPTLPIKRSDAFKILEQQEASSSSSSHQASPSDLAHISSSLAIPGQTSRQSNQGKDESSRPLLWTLQRSSPTDFQLCSIPDFTYTPSTKPSSHSHTSASASATRSRQDLIRSAQALLEPLKKTCLYHTAEWFTYSFCHGREIRQFRRLAARSAAEKAFKAAGGGEAGKKAAVEAADKVTSAPHPVADPEFPAFILGRWTQESEDIVGDDRSYQRHQQQQPLSGSSEGKSTGVAAVNSNNNNNNNNHHPGMSPILNSAGLDLVEEVQFGDWDEEELFAAEAKALSHFKDHNNAVESPLTSGASGHESQRHRYLTQRWTNGTMCDMNHQPRTVEVQFHCSNRKPLEDRILMFKETTICNYVLVIETPKLCADSAFGSEKEDVALPIQCHKVVGDDYNGPNVGEPDRVPPPAMDEIEGGDGTTLTQSEVDNSSTSSKKGEDASSEDTTATANSDESAEQASTKSHTYGDLSRYGSVHDDYYDEALGGPGAMYQEYHQDYHHHDHHHDHDSDFSEAEVMVEIGVDENGNVLVNKVSESDSSTDSPTTPLSGSDGKEPRRRESGKKRSDDDVEEGEKPMEIQLDIDDFLSVLRGEEGGSLEKKLAEKISQVLNQQMQQDTLTPRTDDDDEGQEPSSINNNNNNKGKKQIPEDLARLYQKFMAAVTGEGAAGQKQRLDGTKGKKAPVGKQGHQGQGGLRMEKVGDSLSERVKRFYDAKEREAKKKETPPEIAQHLEL